ncbi:hypothetical protein I7I50_07140 [Histoplasma capsulatum G186AR]|uniref:Uncharacterized protein n=1 Tax=Ajellomyces capsulatus TaxID=5037 RepID=A0A8H8D2M5_AJECA|nr:hypothetical protein I7I52_09807 [Histoplasma capsulatum]QSS67919.1 hypothetical protein I7I50_07140 [Histoplasma capsulatum G186AR]
MTHVSPAVLHRRPRHAKHISTNLALGLREIESWSKRSYHFQGSCWRNVAIGAYTVAAIA